MYVSAVSFAHFTRFHVTFITVPYSFQAFVQVKKKFFLLQFPMKRLATSEGRRRFHFLSRIKCRPGTSPKGESGIGLTQFRSTCCIIRCSSRRRTWPSQFHRLFLARITASNISSRDSSAIVLLVILDSILDTAPCGLRRTFAVSFQDLRPCRRVDR